MRPWYKRRSVEPFAARREQAEGLLGPWHPCLHESPPYDVVDGKMALLSALGFSAHKSMVALRAHLRPAMANRGAAQVESQPEPHRNSNRLVIEGKAARCNWHCHQPVRRVKAGCRIQPGPADQIISPEAYRGLIPFDHRPVPCALPCRAWNGGFWHGSPADR